MKFYNPFKAHIVQLQTGQYCIRKFSMSGWKYLDRRFYDSYWWRIYVINSLIPTEQEAKERLNNHVLGKKFIYQ